MNRIFLFVAFITLIFSEELRAQDETPRSLGNIIQQLSVDAPELSQESENDFIDPDFL
jgi:hypothetical protein